MNKTVIEFKNVNKIYKLYNKPIDRMKEALSFKNKKFHNNYYALSDVTFKIEKGDTVGIIGANGAGKSTLLKIITGVLKETSGMVQVDGKISALLELGTGFNPEYTGMENIYLYGMMMGFSKDEMDEKLNSIVKFADIGNFINQPVKNYSSGMFVRLAFSVSISIEPDILIVDEALSVGDAYFQSKSMNKMKELFEKGKTVIFVTHDTSIVKSLCKTAIYMKSGKIIGIGNSSEIVDLYEKDVRESMQETLSLDNTETKLFEIERIGREKNIEFKDSKEFADKVANYRQGLGNAIVTNVEILDENGNVQNEVDFNESIKIRISIKFVNSCRICVGYHIRDNKNIEIIGSNTVFENTGELVGAKDDKVIVDFHTNTPLIEGNYNISTVLSTIKVHNRSAVFEDYTQGGCVFTVKENLDCKIWNKVYVKNIVSIKRI